MAKFTLEPKYTKDTPCKYCGGPVIRKRWDGNGKLEAMHWFNKRQHCHKYMCFDKAKSDLAQMRVKARKVKAKERKKTPCYAKLFLANMTTVDRWLTGAA